jgi:phosphate transport system protein
MSGEAEAALKLAVEALLERNNDKAAQVIAGDKVVDSMEVEVEESCIDLLALQQPMAATSGCWWPRSRSPMTSSGSATTR